MSWDRLIAFTRAEAPAFAASLNGVSTDAIGRIEQEYRVTLPEAYRQFLLLMGEDSAGFQLFGGQNQRFFDVVARLREDSCPVQEFFKIAFADDPSLVSPPDHFLDLTRSDGVDAPIVLFEGGEDFNRADIQEKGFTFLEQAYRRLFAHLADERLPERALVAISNPTPDQRTVSIGAVAEVFEQMRFAEALPPLSRVDCLRRDDVWSVVDEHLGGRGVAVRLWSSDRRRLGVIVDQLLVLYPHATTHDRPRRPGR